MPCAESRLIEKPQVKNEPASCQNASVCSASPAVTRSTGGALAPAFTAAPSAVSPIDSGESRTTSRQSGSTRSRTPAAMTTYVRRQPVVRISHVTAGTSRLIPVIDALPSTDSAVPRRLLNQRDRQQHGADGGNHAHAEAVEQHAGDRHEDAVQEQAHRDHQREAHAIEVEIGH